MNIVQRYRMAIGVLAVSWLTSCAPPRDAAPESRKELLRLATNSIEIVLAGHRSSVQLEEDLFLTLETTAPAELDVFVPPAGEFLEGFAVRGEFDEPPVKREGRIALRRRLHLRARISPGYRVGPIPVRYVDHGRNPAVEGAISVPSVPLAVVLPVGAPPGDIVAVFEAIDERLSWLGFARRVAPAAVGMLAVALIALRFRRRMPRATPRLSPRAEALRRLADLMACGLPAKGRVGEFYRRLSDIVRAYIECTHAIMAPERTTEELLEAVSYDARFDTAFVAALARFLREADGVKFAARQPDPGAIGREVDLAREIIGEE